MTAADHANRLRESLANASHAFDVDGRQVLASEMQRNIQDVDALQTQAETAEEERVLTDVWRRDSEAYKDRWTAEQAKRRAAEAERDRWKNIADDLTDLPLGGRKYRLSELLAERDAAVRERDHAQNALRQIEVVTRRAIKEGFLHQADWKEVGHIARAALGDDA